MVKGVPQVNGVVFAAGQKTKAKRRELEPNCCIPHQQVSEFHELILGYQQKSYTDSLNGTVRAGAYNNDGCVIV